LARPEGHCIIKELFGFKRLKFNLKKQQHNKKERKKEGREEGRKKGRRKKEKERKKKQFWEETCKCQELAPIWVPQRLDPVSLCF
jgi:predicted transposase YdaD